MAATTCDAPHAALLDQISAALRQNADSLGCKLVSRINAADHAPQVMLTCLRSRPWHSASFTGQGHQIMLDTAQTGVSAAALGALTSQLAITVANLEMTTSAQTIVETSICEIVTRIDASSGIVHGHAVIDLLALDE